jgi:site-specific DNA-methyltransferase (adenine-specific)
MENMLIHGDCLEVMKDIPDKSVDMILADLPYGTTACKWDSIIDLDLLWKQYKRIIKDNGAIVLTASQPFTTKLIASNYEMFRYCWVWDKKLSTNVLHCNQMPLKRLEDICIFYKKLPTYNPIKTIGKPRLKGKVSRSETNAKVNHKENQKQYLSNEYYPTTILEISNAVIKGRVHPTQKPIALMEYLIKTYTNENDMVLDNTMGSGTTCLAAKNLNRRYIGIEKDDKYFEIAVNRIKQNEDEIAGRLF